MAQRNDPSVEGTNLPTSLAQVRIIARYEILNYFRSRRFFVLLAISLLLSALLTIVIAYYGVSTVAGSPPQPIAFYSLWWMLVSAFLVVFCAVFFGADAISGEFQNKTGYFLVGNPIRRSSIYVGKWIAAFTASLITIGVFTAVTVGNGLFYLGANIPIQFVEAFLFTIVYLIAALGFSFFFSSLFKSSSFSIIVSVVLLLFGFTLIDDIVTAIAHIEPWYSLSYATGIINSVFTIPYPPHTSSISIGGAATLTTYVPSIPEGLAIMGIYFVITAILGLLLFEKKEFN